MIKSFDDPEFLLEEFYNYNEEVGGKAREEDSKKDKFNDLCKIFKENYEKAAGLFNEKLEKIERNLHEVIFLVVVLIIYSLRLIYYLIK